MKPRRRQRGMMSMTRVPREHLLAREDLPWVRFFARNVLDAGYLSDGVIRFALRGVDPRTLGALCARFRRALASGSPAAADFDCDGDAEDLARAVARAVGSGTLTMSARELAGLLVDALGAEAARVPTTKRISRIANQFDLDAGQARVLMFLHLCDTVVELSSLVDELDEPGGMQVLACAARVSLEAARAAAGPGGTLQRRHLLKDAATLQMKRADVVQPFVADYLCGSSGESIVDYFCEELAPSPFGVEEFAVGERTASVVQALLTVPGRTNILLSGPPGVGKSEFARTLAARAALRPVRVRRRADDSVDRLRGGVSIAISLVDPERDVLIVDEADAILSGGSSFASLFSGGTEKGWLNDLLDDHSHKVVWIVNTTQRIDASTRRRFDYSVAFLEPGLHERERIWERLIERHELVDRIDQETTTQLAQRYEVGPGAIDRCLAVAARTSDRAAAVLPDILDRHVQLTRGGSQPRVARRGTYDPGLCATDVDLRLVSSSILSYWGSGEPHAREPGDGVSVLLTGPPGTGKSAYARHLADELGTGILEKKASDLIAPYVGQTEQNIAATFAEARERAAVLLLDEADSFLGAREHAHRSWEITQVNELLKQMEQHVGVLVCCTNLVDRIDPAAMRRFTWKVRFGAPDATARRALFAAYFPHASLDVESSRRLDAMAGLTPGDFAVVARRHAHGAQGPSDAILDALEQERSYREPRSRVAGFAPPDRAGG